MNHILGLKCLVCGENYTLDEAEYVCPKHGNDGILDIVYDYTVIKRDFKKSGIGEFGNGDGIWRYKSLLPIHPSSPVPPLTVGDTPLYQAPRLAAGLDIRKLWVKDEGRQPSASLKDRASAVAVVKAWEEGAEIIATASTGNAAAALACLCSSVEQANVIFVPVSTPPAKVAQLLVYGSTVLLVDGTYSEAFELCIKVCKEFGWYNRNTGYNPYMSEGKKTVVFEICEQLGNEKSVDWDTPDVMVVPVGDGCIIGGVHKGFKDLLALGWIEQMPRLIGVQSAGSDYMWQAWSKGEDLLTKSPIAADTLADSINTDLPRDRIKAMAAIQETDGAFVRVSDGEILKAIPKLARGVGVFAEPAAAASYAGLVRAVKDGVVTANDRVVLLATGNGLKDIQSAMLTVSKPYQVAPNLDDVKRVLESRKM